MAKRCVIVRIYELVIEPGREEHIARHQVSVQEVEEVVFGVPFIRKARQGRYHIIGQTEAGRYRAVFVAPRGGACTVYSLPGMQMMLSVELFCGIRKRNIHDKTRTRANEGL